MDESLIMDILPQAIQSKDYDLIYSLIANNSLSNINAKINVNDTDASLIYFAVKDKSNDLVQILLANPDIDVNTRSATYFTGEGGKRLKKCERTLLNIAVENESVEIVQYLLSKPEININAKDVDYEKYIENAINESGEQVPFLYYENHYTALYTAINKGNNILVKLLLNTLFIDTNYQYTRYWHSPSHGEHKYEITALSLAIEKRNVDIIRLLLSASKINVNLKSSYEEGKVDKIPIIDAVETGNIDIVQLLLSQPQIDVNAITKYGYREDNYSDAKREWQEKSALYIACEEGYADIVRLLLLSPNIDANKLYEYEYYQEEFRQEDQNPYYQQHYRGFECHFKKTVLIVAIEKNKTDVVKTLIECPNVDVNINMNENYLSFSSDQSSLYQKSPIYLAVYNQNVDIVKILLTRPEIDLEFKSTRHGEIHTPLQLAQENQSLEIIQALTNSISQ